MNEFTMMNVVTIQRRMCYVGIPMNVSSIINGLMVQRRRCCSFDSPGFARSSPTPGQRLQGDSTPLVLSFFQESMAIVMELMVDYT